MTVYIVMIRYYYNGPEHDLDSVFDSREKAENFQKKRGIETTSYILEREVK
jgi:hypothetical protein